MTCDNCQSRTYRVAWQKMTPWTTKTIRWRFSNTLISWWNSGVWYEADALCPGIFPTICNTCAWCWNCKPIHRTWRTHCTKLRLEAIRLKQKSKKLKLWVHTHARAHTHLQAVVNNRQLITQLRYAFSEWSLDRFEFIRRFGRFVWKQSPQDLFLKIEKPIW